MILRTISLGFQLRADAAASYLREIRDGCPRGVTSAYRTSAAQESIFLARYTRTPIEGRVPVRWNGENWYRKGTLTAAVPGTSDHELGLALDLPEPARTWVRLHGAAYGWDRPRKSDGTLLLPKEPWHFVYDPARDTKRPVVIEEDGMNYLTIQCGDTPIIQLWNPATDAIQPVANMIELERLERTVATRAQFANTTEFAAYRAEYKATLAMAASTVTPAPLDVAALVAALRPLFDAIPNAVNDDAAARLTQ